MLEGGEAARETPGTDEGSVLPFAIASAVLCISASALLLVLVASPAPAEPSRTRTTTQSRAPAGKSGGSLQGARFNAVVVGKAGALTPARRSRRLNASLPKVHSGVVLPLEPVS